MTHATYRANIIEIYTNSTATPHQTQVKEMIYQYQVNACFLSQLSTNCTVELTYLFFRMDKIELNYLLLDLLHLSQSGRANADQIRGCCRVVIPDFNLGDRRSTNQVTVLNVT